MTKQIKKTKSILSKIIIAFFAIVLGLSSFGTIFVPVYAANNTENISSSGFKLNVCDGPAGVRNQLDPSSKEYKEFVPCDFRAVMILIQHLINIMISVGVVAAVAGFSYAGFLYITHVPAKITLAHEIFKKVGIGLVLMLSAWAIVYQILTWLQVGKEAKGLLN